MKSVKHLLRIKLFLGLLDISRMARLCLISCENEGPWLGLLCEFDFEDFASETAALALTSSGPSVSFMSASPNFPLFVTALPAVDALRLVPFEAALVFGTAPFVVAPLTIALPVQPVPCDAEAS